MEYVASPVRARVCTQEELHSLYSKAANRYIVRCIASSATTTASISIGTLASSATADDVSNASEVLSVPSGYDFCPGVQGTASDTQDGNPIVSVTCNSGTTLPGHVSATLVPPPASLGSTPAQAPGKTVSGGARCHGDGHRRRKECSLPSVLAVNGLVTPTALDKTANSLRVYGKSSLPMCGPALRTSIGLSPPMQSEMALSISATATSPTSSTTIPSLSVTCGTMATSTPASNLTLGKGSTNPIDFMPINDRSVSASGGHCKKREANGRRLRQCRLTRSLSPESSVALKNRKCGGSLVSSPLPRNALANGELHPVLDHAYDESCQPGMDNSTTFVDGMTSDSKHHPLPKPAGKSNKCGARKKPQFRHHRSRDLSSRTTADAYRTMMNSQKFFPDAERARSGACPSTRD